MNTNYTIINTEDFDFIFTNRTEFRNSLKKAGNQFNVKSKINFLPKLSLIFIGAIAVFLLLFLNSQYTHLMHIQTNNIFSKPNVQESKLTRSLRQNILNVYAADLPNIQENQVYYEKIQTDNELASPIEGLGYTGSYNIEKWLTNTQYFMININQSDISKTVVIPDENVAKWYSNKFTQELSSVDQKEIICFTQQDIEDSYGAVSQSTFYKIKPQMEQMKGKDFASQIAIQAVNLYTNPIFKYGHTYEQKLEIQKFYITKLLTNIPNDVIINESKQNSLSILDFTFTYQSEFDKNLSEYKLSISFNSDNFKVQQVTSSISFDQYKDFPGVGQPIGKTTRTNNSKLIKSQILPFDKKTFENESQGLQYYNWTGKQEGCYQNQKFANPAASKWYIDFRSGEDKIADHFNSNKKEDIDIVNNYFDKMRAELDGLKLHSKITDEEYNFLVQYTLKRS